MSTLADFALLAAVPSYGGAEILRAQRVLPMGPGPRVHLALFGRNERVMHRVVAAANAGAAILHPAIARIYEVSRFDGVVYGVADPSEGLDLTALLATRRPAPMEVGLAVTASIARVAVAVHDAGGPGYRGPPLGLGAVLAGGLDPGGVFLEPNGAVRLRPLAAAGADPDQPSGFRAPEGEVSMAADVYSLGRLLMALLSGDPTGQTVPRVSSSSSLSALMSRLVHARASERPHLHEVVTRLETLLREQNVGGPDRIVRAALLGPYRSMVMDPGLGLDAAPRVVDTLRMQLAFIYPAVERLWPTMTPSVMLPPPPPPRAQAALPPAVGDDDVDVFTDARPAVRRQRAKTAATLMIGAADVAAAVAAASGEGNAFKPRTSPTLLIPTAELLKALPPAGAAPVADAAGPVEHTRLIDPASFSPFSPPPPPPPATRSTPTPTPSPSLPRKTNQATPPPSQRPAQADNHVVVVVDTGDSDDRTQMLPPEAGDLMARLAASEGHNALAEAADFARDWSVNNDEQGDVFSDDGSGFVNSLRASTSSTAPTGVSSAPVMSEDGGFQAMANAPTAMGKARVDEHDAPSPRTRPVMPGFGVSSSQHGLEDAFDDAFSSPPNSSASATHAPAMTLRDDDGATATRRGVNDSSEPDVIDDGADFVMVGDGGQTYDSDDNPFGASTRLYPAQAMQVARPVNDDEDDDKRIDDKRIDGATVMTVDDPDDPDRQSDVFSREQSLALRRGVVASRTNGNDVRTELVNVAQLDAAMRNRDADERPMATAAPAAAVSAEGVAVGQGMGPTVPPTSAAPPERSRPVPHAGRPSPASPAAAARASVPEVSTMSQLLVDAPEGATVTLNGTIIGTGRTAIDVAADFRAVVKVTMQGHAPFSTVVSVRGRPRVRVTPVLKTR